jgi:SAM-dependent methyltransferase
MDDGGTWHHGLVARWWAEFAEPEPGEIAYLRTAIERYGEPVLDAGCGSGRVLVPLLEAGVDVDGTDVSADMVAYARQRAGEARVSPRLTVQPLHELALGRTYRTILLWDVLGIGGRRDRDRLALRRIRRHLQPGGALLVAHELPYVAADEEPWSRWLPGHRAAIPRPWPETGDRRALADGDDLELLGRLREFHPLEQRRVLEIRARLWHGGRVVAEEVRTLEENLYFAQEVLLSLADAGFADVSIEARWSGSPATDDDARVVFVARA